MCIRDRSITPPVRGSAMATGTGSLRWTISALGVSGNEGASLEFLVRHTAQTGGVKLVNDSITYSDAEGNAVTFPDPSVTVECSPSVTPEPCPCLLYTSRCV